MFWLVVCVLISTIGGYKAVKYVVDGMSQRKSCAVRDCRWNWDDGMCHHKCPCVDGRCNCATYEKRS